MSSNKRGSSRGYGCATMENPLAVMERPPLWRRIRWMIERNIREWAYPFVCYAVGLAALRYAGLI